MNQKNIDNNTGQETVSVASLRLATVSATVSVADVNSPSSETLGGTVATGTVAPRPGLGFYGKPFP